MNKRTLLQICLITGFTMLLALVIISAFNASGEGEGTYPPPTNGDWIITNKTLVSNETIILNGNLNVRSDGFLILNNVTLFMNSSFDGEFMINISKNGEFITEDSNISAYDSELGYNFTVYGNMTINRSEISYVLGEPLKDYYDNPGGIVIYSNKVRIFNSTISHNRERGISIINSSPIIDNNRIFDNNYQGIFLEHSEAVIINNTFSYYSRNGGNDGILLRNFSNATITNNIFIDVTITLYQSSPIITNNTIIQVAKSMTAICIWDFSNPVITNNLIKNLKSGISIINGNEPLIEDNTIINISGSGIRSSTSRITDIGSDVEIMNNNILNCGIGLDINKGSATIIGNNISDGGGGIVLGSGAEFISISENIIYNNSKYGIWCQSGESVFVSGNTILKNNWSGITLNDMVNITIIDNKIISNTNHGISTVGIYQAEVTYNATITNNSISGSEFGISFENHYSKEIITNINNLITDCRYGLYIIEGSSPVITNFTILNTSYGIWIGRGPWIGGNNYPELRNFIVSNSSYGIRIEDQSHPTVLNASISNLEYGVYIINSRLTINNSVINSSRFDFYLRSTSVVNASNVSFDDNKLYLKGYSDKIVLPDREIQGPFPRSSTESIETESKMHWYIFIIGLIVISIMFGFTEPGKYRILLLFLPLYTRLNKDEILDQSTKENIHGYIIANPGEHYNVIRKRLNIRNGTLAYHLNVLKREKLIKSRRDGIYKRFYPAEMSKSEIEKIEANGRKLKGM